jgi:hypothetical protein
MNAINVSFHSLQDGADTCMSLKTVYGTEAGGEPVDTHVNLRRFMRYWETMLPRSLLKKEQDTIPIASVKGV